MNETDDVTSMPKEGTTDLFAKEDKTSPGPSWKIVKHQIQDPDRNKKFFEKTFYRLSLKNIKKFYREQIYIIIFITVILTE